jgi:hypothetical protein
MDRRAQSLLRLHGVHGKSWLPATVWFLDVSCSVSHRKWANSNYTGEDANLDRLLESAESLTLWQSTLPMAQCLTCGLYSQTELGANPGSATTCYVILGKLPQFTYL